MMRLKVQYEDGTMHTYDGSKETILYWIKYFSKRYRICIKKFRNQKCEMLLSERW